MRINIVFLMNRTIGTHLAVKLHNDLKRLKFKRRVAKINGVSLDSVERYSNKSIVLSLAGTMKL